MTDMSNSHTELKRRASRRETVLNDIADLQEELKAFKAEDKNDGFNEKAIAQVVKEMRKGVDFQAKQLQLELELDTYRQAVGLPVTLEDAQARALQKSETLPDPDEHDGADEVFGDSDTVQFGDGPEIPARDFAKAARAVRSSKVRQH